MALGYSLWNFSKETAQMLGCLTSAERIADFSRVAPFYLEMAGMHLLQRVPSDYGVVTNPGCPIEFDISPQGVAKILADFTP
jgi:hypothetical protein